MQNVQWNIQLPDFIRCKQTINFFFFKTITGSFRLANLLTSDFGPAKFGMAYIQYFETSGARFFKRMLRT